MLFHSAAALFIRRRFGCFFFLVVPCAFYCLCARFVSDSVAASTFVCHLLEGLFIYQDTHSDTRKLAIRPPSTRKASWLQCNRLIALHKSPVNQLPAVTARTLNPIFSFSFAYGHVNSLKVITRPKLRILAWPVPAFHLFVWLLDVVHISFFCADG